MNAQLDPSESNALNLVKLCVGVDTVEDLEDSQTRTQARRTADGLDPRPRHVTRMWPRRADELLDGGSLYWVIRGVIQVRQRIVALEERIGEDGIRRCAIVFDPELVRTEPRPRSAFQGWRYIAGADAPSDLVSRTREEMDLPVDMRMALLQLGVIGR